MPKFNKTTFVELRNFLYNSYDHDANIKSITCDYENKSIEISLFNAFFGVKINYIFHFVEVVLSIKGSWNGDQTEIIGITAEEDFSYLKKHLSNHSEYNQNSLYLLFQMFSGDELHIVSKEVTIEITPMESDETGDSFLS